MEKSKTIQTSETVDIETSKEEETLDTETVKEAGTLDKETAEEAETSETVDMKVTESAVEIVEAADDMRQKKKKRRILRHSLHMKSFWAGVLSTVLALVLLIAALAAIPFRSEPSSPLSFLTIKKVVALQTLIRTRYLNELDEKNQADLMFSGLVAGIDDKYAAYYTEEEYESIKMSNNGQMEGIGVSITKEESEAYLLVISVKEDSPAERAGVLVNDRIIMLMGTDTSELSSSDAASMIQLSEDKTITMTVIHDGASEEVELSMEKEAIDQSVVVGEMLDDGIGYVYIASFNRLTPIQFEEVYTDLQDQGITSLIIDLRDNRGGLVDACCDTLSLFMPEGDLVYEQDRDGKESSRSCKGENPIEIPVAVLVNANTASASEMFTGAVQDYGVGTVVGTITYGKGIEQESYTFADGSVLKITTTKYFTPNHRDINGTGITPDLEVELDEEQDGDEQLEAAITLLLADTNQESSE